MPVSSCSSLAPEVFRKTFGVADGYLDLAVLDSTDPDAVLAYAESLDLSKTLFIVATKSGGTVETLSFFKYFYNRVAEVVGQQRAGEHFVAITDSGSKLDDLKKKLKEVYGDKAYKGEVSELNNEELAELGENLTGFRQLHAAVALVVHQAPRGQGTEHRGDAALGDAEALGDVPHPGVALLALQAGDGLEVVGHRVRDFLLIEAFPDFHGPCFPEVFGGLKSVELS